MLAPLFWASLRNSVIHCNLLPWRCCWDDDRWDGRYYVGEIVWLGTDCLLSPVTSLSKLYSNIQNSLHLFVTLKTVSSIHRNGGVTWEVMVVLAGAPSCAPVARSLSTECPSLVHLVAWACFSHLPWLGYSCSPFWRVLFAKRVHRHFRDCLASGSPFLDSLNKNISAH